MLQGQSLQHRLGASLIGAVAEVLPVVPVDLASVIRVTSVHHEVASAAKRTLALAQAVQVDLLHVLTSLPAVGRSLRQGTQ